MATLTPAEMDVDQLSDVIPSNLVSRQVSEKPDDESMEDPVEQLEDESEDETGQPNGTSPMSPAKVARLQAQAERQNKSQKRKAQEGDLQVKREQMDQALVADSVKRYSYLLGQTELFQHFVDLKRSRDPVYASLLDAKVEKESGRGKKKAIDKTNRHRKSEKEEDEELMKEDAKVDNDDDQPFVFEESPSFIKGGEMRSYQVQGLNWMVSLHHNGLNGILADEMGLGKTLQTIAFLSYLKFYRSMRGPHLIVVPKSTLQNWAREFAQWAPNFDVVVLTGSKDERATIIAERLLPQKFEVCITSYEICLIEKHTLKKFAFGYIVIDEAHRIKNVDSILSQIVRVFMSRGRLLITGTPLQNNLKELFALLNFICPEIFTDYADLESFLHKDDGGQGEVGEETSRKVVEALHKILRPFLLRRVKSDVEKGLLPKKEINIYVGLSEMQRKWYRSVLEKDLEAVNGLAGKKEGKTRLMNMVMQLRKVTCHPYLFDGAEPGPPYTTDEHLIDNAGKMVILDKLLRSMKSKGSRILIFSQMSRVLDILEDYCMFRQYAYCRIDGSTAHEDRILAIDEYNKPGSEKFIFLLTTRAGGLGINLTTADIVILYDSDWNPQADLQAMDRAHRIGQTKQVYVFRFITEGSVEERMLERAAQKLRLDQLVIQQGRAQQAKAAANKEELLDMITHGVDKIVNSSDDLMINEDIEAVIQRGEQRTSEINNKYEGLTFEDLNNFKSDTTIQQWEGEDFRAGRKNAGFFLEPSKRERKNNYSIDGYYKEAMRANAKVDKGPKLPKAPKSITVQAHQFFPPRFSELQEREQAAYRRSLNYQVPLREPLEGETLEMVEEERKQQQDTIDNAEPLTEEEIQEKEELQLQGFEAWSKRDYQQLVKAYEAHGRDVSAELLAGEITGQDIDSVKEYTKVFWARYKELEDWERIEARITEGEAKREKQSNLEELLQKKISSVRYPMQELDLNYPSTKGKIYSEEEDRYLLVRLAYYGLSADDVYERIKKDITEFPVFRFDWFFKSRTPQELSRRANTLLGMIAKEDEDRIVSMKNGKSKKRTIDELQKTEKASRASTPAGAPKKASAKKAKKV